MDCTYNQYNGDFAAGWQRPVMAENEHWLEVVTFMSEKMKLKEVGIEFKDIRDKSFKIEPSKDYLWHVARKTASLWIEGKIAHFPIFQPGFGRHCWQLQDGRDNETDLIEAAEANDIVRIMRFPWQVKDSKR